MCCLAAVPKLTQKVSVNAHQLHIAEVMPASCIIYRFGCVAGSSSASLLCAEDLASIESASQSSCTLAVDDALSVLSSLVSFVLSVLNLVLVVV